MSWIEKVKNGMRITTGDGVKWDLKKGLSYMNASFQTEYHYTEHNWIDVAGSYIDRKKALGKRYRLELYFEGPNHLDNAKAFCVSADDNRPWEIEHPLYDLLTVQPTALEFDNGEDKLNVTKITGTVIETLEAAPVYLDILQSVDYVPELVRRTVEVAASSLTIDPSVTDAIKMADDSRKTYKQGLMIITDPIDASKYTAAFNTASTYVNSATATPVLAMRSMISLIQLPGQFKASVKDRLRVLFTTFDNLRATIFGLTSVAAKQIFAAEQAACIGGMCTAAATPLAGNYKTRNQVLDTVNSISARYALFISDLDEMQAANAGNTLSFVADDTLMHDMNQLVNATLGNLFEIALGAKQERVITCEKDTNIILLAHELLGLAADDSTINELMDINELGEEELLQIEKGRKITYYV